MLCLGLEVCLEETFVGVCAGNAYKEVMRQISAAVESASQLEMAELLDTRASDGSLPIPPVAKGNAEGKGLAAAAVACLLERKTIGNGGGVGEGAEGSQLPNGKRQRADEQHPEGSQLPNVKRQRADEQHLEASQLPNAKRQRADEQHLERQDGTAAGTAPGGVSASESGQMQEVSQSTAQENRPSSLSQAVGHDLAASVSRNHDPPGSAVAVSAAHQADTDVTIPCGPSATHASTNAMSHDHASPHDADEAGPSIQLPDQDAAHGLDQRGPKPVLSDPAAASSLHPPGPDLTLPDQDAANHPEQPGPNTTLPDQDAANGPEQPGPSSGVPNQAVTDESNQPGPSAPLPYQGQEEEVSHEVREKKEQARSRSRAWRKIFLDGLDLLAELTTVAAAAAATAGDSDCSDLALECQVRLAAATTAGNFDCLDLALECQVRLGFDYSRYTPHHGCMMLCVCMQRLTAPQGEVPIKTWQILNYGIPLDVADTCGILICVLFHHTNTTSSSSHPEYIMPMTATFQTCKPGHD